MFKMVDRCDTENSSIDFSKGICTMFYFRVYIHARYCQNIVGFIDCGYSFYTFQEILISSLVL